MLLAVLSSYPCFVVRATSLLTEEEEIQGIQQEVETGSLGDKESESSALKEYTRLPAASEVIWCVGDVGLHIVSPLIQMHELLLVCSL